MKIAILGTGVVGNTIGPKLIQSRFQNRQTLPVCLLLFLCISCQTSFKTINGHDGFFLSSREGIDKMYIPRRNFYELKKHDTLLSIGAEPGANEVIYGLLTDSVNFILENISSKYLNQPEFDFSQSYYEKIFKKKNTSRYTLQIGNDSSTLLPSSAYTKVLIENSLHEFSEPHPMMKEICRILKPGGSLYLFERMSTPRNPIHGSCGRALFSQEGLTNLMQQEHFRFIKTEVFAEVNLFKFQKE
jgi:hypothetical protein